jgi:hypothetical protein
MRAASTFTALLVSDATLGCVLQLCNRPTFNVTGPAGIINDNSASLSFVANGGGPCVHDMLNCRRGVATAPDPALQLRARGFAVLAASAGSCFRTSL